MLLKNITPQRVWLFITLTLGLGAMLINPPFQAPDECDHFYRVFQISEGGFVSQKGFGNAGGPLPVIAFRGADPMPIAFHYDVKMTRDFWRKKSQPAFIDWSKAERAFCGFPHTVVYPATSYLPQSVAVFLGRHAGVGPLGLMYLARLAGFVASVALGYAALRCLPIFRWSALVLLTCPMSLQLLGSIALDGVLIGATLLLLALVLRVTLAEGSASVSPGVQIAVVALSALIATKVVYLPIAAVALVLVLWRLPGRRQKVIFLIGWTLICLVPAVWWGRVISSIYVPGRSDIPIDPAAQQRVVLAAPLAFLSLVGQSIWIEAGFIYRWFVGTLGWGDTPMPNWFYHAFGWGLLACLILEARVQSALRWTQRGILLAAVLAATLLIFTAQYVTWNAPGSRGAIEGIEGRYFLPLAPLVMMCTPALPGIPQSGRWLTIFASALATLNAVVCVVALIFRYYVA